MVLLALAEEQHLAALQGWAAGLALEGHQASFHVLESGDVARALLTYARGNRVDISSAQIRHSSGAAIQIARDGQGRVASVTDPDGAKWEWYVKTADADQIEMVVLGRPGEGSTTCCP